MGQLKLNGLAATYDKELLTPKHDEMMKFLFKEKVKNKLTQFSQLKEANNIFFFRHNQNQIKKVELTNLKIDLEVPLKTSKGFIVGIIDAVIVFDYTITYLENQEEKITKEQTCCGVEIKPKINSVGEVMRQLKIYNDYLRLNNYTSRKAKIVLFTQDESEREIFESQEIGYISLEEMGDLNE